ncbi:PREDICTED: uncharacterized protein LOC109149589 [Ipomoea nil]|uniref:uncharacterized protein LOC109149589 n=1 Tax=Ipomoea nil TaxID=35883 RepID=UPI0009011E9F|nr:PREDICTED: uncharacterized protein LOC109149589 [Ipomoea nil]
MGITQSEFEALTEIATVLKHLDKVLRKFSADLKDLLPPILSKIKQTKDAATSLESSTIIVDHPHVEIVPMQANVSVDQPHVDSTQKAADSTEIEVVPFPKTVLCLRGLFHHSPTPSHLRVVLYGIGQPSSLVSLSSSNVAVPTKSFKGCPSLGSSSPLFAPPLICRMPVEFLPFVLLLRRPFDRGRCWLQLHEVIKLEDKLVVQEGSNDTCLGPGF